jgi:translation initiation factor IF-3
VILRGRENQYRNLAETLINRFAEDLKELAFIEHGPTFERKSFSMLLSPAKHQHV